MLKARALAKRRRAVQNIWKITRTMGLIATARFKRAADRAIAVAEYTRHLESLLEHMVRVGMAQDSPYWAMEAAADAPCVVLVLTSNRGLCGGYNSAVVRMGLADLNEKIATLPRDGVRLEVSGKRGASMLRFLGLSLGAVFSHLSERPRRADVEALAQQYWEAYRRGELASLDVVYMRLQSLSRQIPCVETLLPFDKAWDWGESSRERWALPKVFEFDIYPESRTVVDQLLPAVFQARLMRAVFDAAASEQIARMVAMRSATENAETMLSRLAILYNRARQTQITSELLELMAAAEALQR